MYKLIRATYLRSKDILMATVDILLSYTLAMIMFGIGISLKFKDFSYVFAKPKALAFGLAMQMLLLPLFSFFIVLLSGLNPHLCVGMLVVALCPGGTMSNFISYLINAEVALSISMTLINSFLIQFTIPAFLSLFLQNFLSINKAIILPFWEISTQIFGIILLPVLFGMLFQYFWKSIANKLQKPLKYISSLCLMLVFGIKFFAGNENGGSEITMDEIFKILPFALIIHVGSMLLSYFFSRKRFLSNREAVTIGIEVGLQNTALALLITGTLIGNEEMSKPALVYALFSFFTTLIFGICAINRNASYALNLKKT